MKRKAGSFASNVPIRDMGLDTEDAPTAHKWDGGWRIQKELVFVLARSSVERDGVFSTTNGISQSCWDVHDSMPGVGRQR